MATGKSAVFHRAPPTRISAVLEWDYRTWTRVLIVLGALGLSAYLATSPRPQLLWLEAMLGIGGLLIILLRPRFSLGLLIVASVLVPFGLGTGSQTTINLTTILISALTVLSLTDRLLSHGFKVSRSRPIRPLLALIAVSLVAFVNGLQPWMALGATAPLASQAGGLAIFVLSACAFMLFGHRVRDYATLSRLTWLFLGVSAVCTVEQTLVRVPQVHALFTIVANGSMFWLWVVILAFSQALLNHRLAWPWRLALLALVGLYMFFALIINRNWTSGWAPEVVALLAILWVGRPRLGLAATVAGLGALLPRLGSVADVLLFQNQKNQYDILSRSAAWEIVGQIVRLDPLLGIGFANYYFYTPQFSILGYYGIRFNSHNNYLDILAQTGVLGLACFFWFFAELFWLAWTLRGRAAPGFARAYVIGIIAAVPSVLLAAFLGDWVLPFVYNIGLAGFRASALAWLFMGGLLVVEQQTVRDELNAGKAQEPDTT